MTDIEKPPNDVPADVAERLEEMDPLTLRRTLDYVRALIRRRSRELRTDVEAGPGEEIVRVVERDDYTEVVKCEPCAEGCPDCPHEPYLYHVTVERRPNGERHQHWTLVGRYQE